MRQGKLTKVPGGVTCPTCKSVISWHKLYSFKPEEERQIDLDKRHSTRCGECGATFTYTPRLVTKRDWRSGWRSKIRSIETTEMKVIEEGKLG